MASDSMEFEFTLAPAEIRGFQRFVFWRSWRLLVWIAIAILTIFLWNLFERQIYGLLTSVGIPDGAVEMLHAWMPFFILSLMIAVAVIIRRRREEKLKQARKRPIYQSQRWTISPAGLKVVRPGMWGEIEWSAVTAVRKRGDVAYLYIDDAQAYVVPARAFTTLAQFEAFYETAQSHFKTAHPDAA